MASPVVTLSPDEILPIRLDSDQEIGPHCELTITNGSEKPIAFKVKTTKPKRYLVRPNQAVIHPGNTSTVKIILQRKDCDDLLKSYLANEPQDSSGSDKFLVQTVFVEGDLLERVTARENDQKAATEELSQMWGAANKKDFVNKKLKCHFEYPPKDKIQASHAGASVDSPSTPVMSPMAGTGADNGVVFSEMQTLRKKYDDLVQFTVQLTSERDQLQKNLTGTQEEVARVRDQLTATKSLGSGNDNSSSDRGAGGTSTTVEKAQSSAGGSFTLLHILAMGLIAFILGRLLGST